MSADRTSVRCRAGQIIHGCRRSSAPTRVDGPVDLELLVPPHLRGLTAPKATIPARDAWPNRGDVCRQAGGAFNMPMIVRATLRQGSEPIVAEVSWMCSRDVRTNPARGEMICDAQIQSLPFLLHPPARCIRNKNLDQAPNTWIKRSPLKDARFPRCLATKALSATARRRKSSSAGPGTIKGRRRAERGDVDLRSRHRQVGTERAEHVAAGQLQQSTGDFRSGRRPIPAFPGVLGQPRLALV